MERIRLHNDMLDVDITPAHGGGLSRFDSCGGGAPVALMRPWTASPSQPHPDDPNQLSCYPLVPWSNRISQGGFTADGHHVALAPNREDEPFPIHGYGWQRAWQVSAATDTEAALQWDECHDQGYSFRAQLRYLLHNHTLHVRLRVINSGILTLPFGLGLHPFFVRDADTLVHAPATQLWMNDGHSPIPTHATAVPAHWDFHEPRALPPEEVNHAFTGWSGHASILWPGKQLALHIDTDMDAFVMYTPTHAGFFCFEPVDHPIDAVHLPGGATVNGMTLLAPGESLQREVAFTVQVLAP